MAITNKDYYCPTCGNEETHSTNHHGEIYCRCLKCGAGTLYCKEETFKGREYVNARMCRYRYNLENKHERAAYAAMLDSLAASGVRCFGVLETPQTAKAELSHAGGVFLRLYKPFLWEGQYVSNVGRLHAWKEYIYPNKNIKEGYFLEITEYAGKEE